MFAMRAIFFLDARRHLYRKEQPMAGKNTPFSVASANWQDYRANNTGMVVYYTSDPVSEIAIREVPEDVDSPVVPEPHYETGTFGLYSCTRPKVRAAFYKEKVRYLFFATKYAGTNAAHAGKMVITGMYHISKTADARRFHIRHCKEYECLEVGTCLALLADEVRFVSLDDAFVVDEAVMTGWNYHAKINRQTRIILTAEQTKPLIEHLRSKPNALQSYLDETRRLLPHGMEDEEVEEEAEEAVEAAAVVAEPASQDAEMAAEASAEQPAAAPAAEPQAQ
jgi:hypothetical protein